MPIEAVYRLLFHHLQFVASRLDDVAQVPFGQLGLLHFGVLLSRHGGLDVPVHETAEQVAVEIAPILYEAVACVAGEVREVCHGARYNRETLEVHYKGKNIAQVLDMTAEEAVDFFENLPKIRRKAQTLVEVGLGYVKLGQSSTTLSGGEAQRVKLATELARVATGKTIYILDEPTTGLHAADVHKLIDVLQRLVDAGNTVLVIEHNLDVIKTADYIIDLGPEGGSGGGYVVATGTPEEVAKVEQSYTGQYLKSYLNS